MSKERVFESSIDAQQFIQAMAQEVNSPEIQAAVEEFLPKYTYCTDGLVSMGLGLIEEAIETLSESELSELNPEIAVIHGYLGRLTISLGEPVKIKKSMGVGEVLANQCRNATIQELKQLQLKTISRVQPERVSQKISFSPIMAT
jgi:hypothetical protein